MKTELKKKLQRLWPDEIQALVREELETAWLRGWQTRDEPFAGEYDDYKQEAADYAERVVGGPTRPERPT